MNATKPYAVLKLNPSKSSPGKFHEIRYSRPENHIYCTCPSWTVGTFTSKVSGKKYVNRRLTPKDRLCKHLEHFSQTATIPGAKPASSAPVAPPAKPALVSKTAWQHILES